MTFKTGLLSSKTLDLKEIEQEMRTTYKEMHDFSTLLVPGKQEGLFLGVGIVVLQTQKSQHQILKTQVSSAITTLLKKTLCICCDD